MHSNASSKFPCELLFLTCFQTKWLAYHWRWVECVIKERIKQTISNRIIRVTTVMIQVYKLAVNMNVNVNTDNRNVTFFDRHPNIEIRECFPAFLPPNRMRQIPENEFLGILFEYVGADRSGLLESNCRPFSRF